MRKILLGLLTLILFAILVTIVVYGLNLGTFHLGYSIRDIIEKNDELDLSIANLQTKINGEYATVATSLSSSFVNLQNSKEEYLNKVKYSTEEEMQKANVTEQYKIGYLWTNIGLYATRNNCFLRRVEVTNATSGIDNQYNITFTAIGEYLDISNFIYAIEKDTNLGFRIEEFNMIPYNQEENVENKLQATFMIKNVMLDPNSLKEDAISSSSDTNVNTDTNNNANANTNNNTNTNNNADGKNTGS